MSSFGNQPSGCCGDTIVNFSLLRMPDKHYLNLGDSSLWCTAGVMFAEPYFKSLVGVQEKRKEIFSTIFGPNIAFFIYVMMSYLYSTWAFLFFGRAVIGQPRLISLQRNEVLIIGYLVLLAGFGMKICTYMTTSITSIMGGYYFKLRSSVSEGGPMSSDPYYHPLGTASVMCYFGFSLIQGSIAGLFLSIILAVAYCMAFQFERFLIVQTRPQSRQSLKQDIHHSRIPPPIRSKRS